MTTRIAAETPVGAAEPRPTPPPCAIVVFGASGDLTARKLMPALYSLFTDRLLDERCAIVGVARREWSSETFREAMREAVSTAEGAKPSAEQWSRFAATLSYVQGAFDDDATYRKLAECLARVDGEQGLQGNRLFYLATPPSEFEAIVRALARASLLRPPGAEAWTRAIVEKPFGRDLASARELDAVLASVLDESQIFRIDHYLGKETVQNVMVLRFANSIFEPVWNRRYVSYVEISASESGGIGSRGRFYEQTGVLRDVVQNHLLEVLALTAMEPPTTAAADDIRGEKLKVLQALRDMTRAEIDRNVVLGQYRGYRDEPNVSSTSTVPTYAALRVYVDSWRWQGVPFYLRTGKRLASRTTQVSLHMQPVPLCLFRQAGSAAAIHPNVLTLRIQPNEGISMRFASKIPGHEMAVGSVAMDMDYVETFGSEPPPAYERLLLDAIRGDATLFSRRDAVEASWAWMTPILEHFEGRPPADFPNYEPGSSGPEAAEQLVARDRRTWCAL